MDKLEDRAGLHAAAHCPDTAKRHQVLEGARRIFLQDGFDGASIGDIVRAAGVSKGTLYAYFPSKESLFEALMAEDRRTQAEALFTIDDNDRDVAGVLRRLGQSFAEMLYAPGSLDLLRIVIGAAAKFPSIGKAFFDAGPCRGTRRLGHYLEGMTQQGILRVGDPELAARQFLDLCKTGIHLRLLLGDQEPPTPEEIERNIDSAVKVFLAAYGPAGEKRD